MLCRCIELIVCIDRRGDIVNQASFPHAFNSLTNESVRIKVVDIGANMIEELPPYAGMVMAGNADVVGFEPNLEALAELNAKKGPNEVYLPHTIGDGARHTFNCCQAPGMSSILKPNPNVLNMFHGFPDWSLILATEEVDTVKLDSIPETAGVDLIKIDIQGAELMALRHAKKRLKDALVIQVEVEFLQLYVDQPLFADIDMFLRKHNFVFHRFFPLFNRMIQPMLSNNDIYAEGLSQTLYADAIFVRDFTHLDKLSETQVLKMAAILHDCYQSYDLVLNLLTQYDRRTGKALGPDYLPALRRSVGIA